MWIRTINGIIWVEAEQTKQGMWLPKSSNNNLDNMLLNNKKCRNT